MGIIEEMVIEYADVDENKRLDMFLEYPYLRGPFQEIDQSNLNSEMGAKALAPIFAEQFDIRFSLALHGAS